VEVVVSVPELLSDNAETVIAEAAAAASKALAAGSNCVVHTSREYVPTDAPLDSGARVAAGLATTIRTISTPAALYVTKGGISSHVVMRDGLGVRSATVLGQLSTGISVYQSPTMQAPVVVVPGNVGTEHTLTDILRAAQQTAPPQPITQEHTMDGMS
jgi:uncharacterized protein YgbK (DUF1537 family)